MVDTTIFQKFSKKSPVPAKNIFSGDADVATGKLHNLIADVQQQLSARYLSDLTGNDKPAAITDSSGGTANSVAFVVGDKFDGTVLTAAKTYTNILPALRVPDSTSTNTAANNMWPKTNGALRLTEVAGAIKELITKANAFASALGMATVTVDTIAAAADGTVSEISNTEGAVSAGGMAIADVGKFTVLAKYIGQTARYVNEICYAAGQEVLIDAIRSPKTGGAGTDASPYTYGTDVVYNTLEKYDGLTYTANTSVPYNNREFTGSTDYDFSRFNETYAAEVAGTGVAVDRTLANNFITDARNAVATIIVRINALRSIVVPKPEYHAGQ